ncbi:AAA family ATPase [Sporosarcina thermotolerans]|uniref:AAA family ATPase n=1 Tax=Sporosarcina thermotolerans TaxID=633404 RepID=A0AAW9A942_9BACL|nr:AAA family ATPase [Sporosarcina thermotolerans]MDW0117932.1 AAA family ATPase [Sporosarcina thermotolerans]WHT49019.1 AAA family ATPase [Sporosarcina thermotolerans]
MIVMINGAFGVGKTSVANKLLQKLDGAMLFDPEEVGYMLRHIIPEDEKLEHERTGDFQDLDMWKPLTVEVAKQLRETYGKDLIVPMTIYTKEYFDTIHSGFLQIDPETYHFCLTAKKETIHDRLIERGEEEGNWCFAQTDKCLEGFKNPCLGQFISTDDASIEEIAKFICKEIG